MADPQISTAPEVTAGVPVDASEPPRIQEDTAEVMALPAPKPEDGGVADEAVAQAERIAFLAMASELARGRKVLVVDDGASALAGIAAHLDSVEVGALDGPADGSYQLVVADLLVADETAAFGVDNLARIAAQADGAVLVRLPNRPEFAPLLQKIETTFARNLKMRQHNWVASALFDDAMFENEDPSKAVAATVRKLSAAQAGDELYTVVLAAHAEFPHFRPQLAVTRSVLTRNLMLELAATKERAAADIADLNAEKQSQAERIAELEEELAWYDEHELALRSQIEGRGWAMSLVNLWARAVVLLRRARNSLG